MDYPFVEFLFIFFVSASSLYIFRKIAKAIGLVDKPNERKCHDGTVPLIGGVSICFTVVHYLYFNPVLADNNSLFILSITVLTLLGAIDDRFDVSFKLRIFVQAIISIVMIEYSGIVLVDLGNMFGFGEVHLGWLGIPITVLAVVGAINAFNMVDGIDGLLGGLSIVTFASVAVLMAWTGQEGKLYVSLLFIIAIIPFIFLNLGIIGRERKVFMGDAGSMMIGFTVVWLLLGASQEESVNTIRPVTCLWLIAIPLFDMASIVMRRLKRGTSPFYPDRDHLHHILQRYEVSTVNALVIICGTAVLFAALGVIGEVYAVSEVLMFVTFIMCFISYHLILKRLSRIKPHRVRVVG